VARLILVNNSHKLPASVLHLSDNISSIYTSTANNSYRLSVHVCHQLVHTQCCNADYQPRQDTV